MARSLGVGRIPSASATGSPSRRTGAVSMPGLTRRATGPRAGRCVEMAARPPRARRRCVPSRGPRSRCRRSRAPDCGNRAGHLQQPVGIDARRIGEPRLDDLTHRPRKLRLSQQTIGLSHLRGLFPRGRDQRLLMALNDPRAERGGRAVARIQVDIPQPARTLVACQRAGVVRLQGRRWGRQFLIARCEPHRVASGMAARDGPIHVPGTISSPTIAPSSCTFDGRTPTAGPGNPDPAFPMSIGRTPLSPNRRAFKRLASSSKSPVVLLVVNRQL